MNRSFHQENVTGKPTYSLIVNLAWCNGHTSGKQKIKKSSNLTKEIIRSVIKYENSSVGVRKPRQANRTF